ncbi:hypothetical protein Dimus_037142 [Dionaea muscipula]
MLFFRVFSGFSGSHLSGASSHEVRWFCGRCLFLVDHVVLRWVGFVGHWVLNFPFVDCLYLFVDLYHTYRKNLNKSGIYAVLGLIYGKKSRRHVDKRTREKTGFTGVSVQLEPFRFSLEDQLG